MLVRPQAIAPEHRPALPSGVLAVFSCRIFGVLFAALAVSALGPFGGAITCGLQVTPQLPLVEGCDAVAILERLPCPLGGGLAGRRKLCSLVQDGQAPPEVCPVNFAALRRRRWQLLRQN